MILQCKITQCLINQLVKNYIVLFHVFIHDGHTLSKDKHRVKLPLHEIFRILSVIVAMHIYSRMYYVTRLIAARLPLIHVYIYLYTYVIIMYLYNLFFFIFDLLSKTS